MTDLKGKHALVTGGGSGVGASIALTLAGAGADVTITGRREEALKTVAEQHPAIDYVTGDVTSPRSVQDLFADASKRRGAAHIVVANAGVATSRPFDAMTANDLEAMLGVNLGGVVHVWQAGLKSMRAEGWGRLIAIASTAGLKGYPYVSGYCASKHAVLGLTRSVALELAKTGITVNAVCPGFTETPMLEQTLDTIVLKTGRSREEAASMLKTVNPQGCFIKPNDVASGVLWLCDETSGAVTGQAIAISGGEV